MNHALDILRSKIDQNDPEAVRAINTISEHLEDNARRALDSLTMAELSAVKAVVKSLDGLSGSVVAGQLIDGLGISRSSSVSAFQKLQAGGVLMTKSRGSKGTYIAIASQEIKDMILSR